METRDSVITIGEDVYPRWATTVGWLIICSSLICIPACAVFQLYKAKGTFLQVFNDIFDMFIYCKYFKHLHAKLNHL